MGPLGGLSTGQLNCCLPRMEEKRPLVYSIELDVAQKDVCQKDPRKWHKVLPLVLWTIRESKNETLGSSPHVKPIEIN